ncbi:unnamed protein product, partial [Staurois parvus]
TQGQTELLLRNTELLLRATELLLGATETLIRDTELLLRATELLLRATELLLAQTQNCYSGTQNCYSGTHNRLIKEYVRHNMQRSGRGGNVLGASRRGSRGGGREQHYSQPEASAPGVIQRSCLHRQPCRRRLVGSVVFLFPGHL